MTTEDVKEGEYYVAFYPGETHPTIIKAFVKASFNHSPGLYKRLGNEEYNFVPSNSFQCRENIRLAREDEIHWLNCCIELNTYISYDEAMKSFFKTPENKPEDKLELETIYKKLLNL